MKPLNSFWVGLSGFIAAIYDASLAIMGNAAAVAFEVAGGEAAAGYTGIAALAASGEKAITEVVHVAQAIISSGPRWDLSKYFFALILILPYVALIVVYLAQVVVAVFRVMILAAFGPFLILCFSFGWGRQMAVSGLKAIISTGLILFACTVALAMTIYGVASLDLSAATEDPSNFSAVDNPGFLVAIALGWLGIAFMAESTSVANSVAGTFLTNIGAAVISSGAAATGLGLLKGVASGPKGAARLYNRFSGGGGGGSGGSDADRQVADLIHRIKNINTDK